MHRLIITWIGWPFAVGQPLNIAHMARNLDVGFELTTVRTGACPLANHKLADAQAASGSLARFEAELGSILDETRGEVGQRK